MRIVLVVFGVVIAATVIVVGIGYALPVKHTATRAISLNTTADSVYALISNSASFPEWRSGVKSVELVSGNDARTSYVEHGKDGDIFYVVDAAEPPNRLVTRIADDKLPFGGTWTFEISTQGTDTQLRITENGEVYNPLFRFMSRFVFGHHASIETYLRDVARKFGQDQIPQMSL